MIASLGRTKSAAQQGRPIGPRGRTIAIMGRPSMAIEIAAASVVEPKDADDCFALGMNFSIGADVAIDLIEAHKWFNIAATRGHSDGARLRREIAEQMADAEIGLAQRAARDWLKSHPLPVMQRPEIRAAA
jgi:TPR repeat protein